MYFSEYYGYMGQGYGRGGMRGRGRGGRMVRQFCVLHYLHFCPPNNRIA